MCGEKNQRIIESVKNMTDKEADILAVFVAGLKAGRQITERGAGKQMACESVEKTA